MGTKRNRQNYTKEFKADVVKLVTEQGYSCTEVRMRFIQYLRSVGVLEYWSDGKGLKSQYSISTIRVPA